VTTVTFCVLTLSDLASPSNVNSIRLSKTSGTAPKSADHPSAKSHPEHGADWLIVKLEKSGAVKIRRNPALMG
jgi:hypothetical protein